MTGAGFALLNVKGWTSSDRVIDGQRRQFFIQRTDFFPCAVYALHADNGVADGLCVLHDHQIADIGDRHHVEVQCIAVFDRKSVQNAVVRSRSYGYTALPSSNVEEKRYRSYRHQARLRSREHDLEDLYPVIACLCSSEADVTCHQPSAL